MFIFWKSLYRKIKLVFQVQNCQNLSFYSSFPVQIFREVRIKITPGGNYSKFYSDVSTLQIFRLKFIFLEVIPLTKKRPLIHSKRFNNFFYLSSSPFYFMQLCSDYRHLFGYFYYHSYYILTIFMHGFKLGNLLFFFYLSLSQLFFTFLKECFVV